MIEILATIGLILLIVAYLVTFYYLIIRHQQMLDSFFTFLFPESVVHSAIRFSLFLAACIGLYVIICINLTNIMGHDFHSPWLTQYGF